jgi:hypothetical protein
MKCDKSRIYATHGVSQIYFKYASGFVRQSGKLPKFPFRYTVNTYVCNEKGNMHADVPVNADVGAQ